MALATELTQTELEALFAQLAEQWHDETGMYSISRQKVSHPAYLKIIGLGPRAIPLIIRDLKLNGGWWFDALEALTRQNPAAELDSNKPREIAQAWLHWAAEEGITLAA